jgi:hypothetical protein
MGIATGEAAKVHAPLDSPDHWLHGAAGLDILPIERGPVILNPHSPAP